MSKANEPAFPQEGLSTWVDGEKINQDFHEGLTKREYFAAMAMQGFAHMFKHGRLDTAKHTAYEAVVLADALLGELEKSNA